mgnify:CR=1 FL=1
MLPSLSIVNVEMKPSRSVPLYANAYVSESTCTRELWLPLSVSCSKLFPSDWVFTAVMLPSLSIVNVEIRPSPPGLSSLYANAYVPESTCTRELCIPLPVSCSKVSTSVIVVPSDEMVNVAVSYTHLTLPTNREV